MAKITKSLIAALLAALMLTSLCVTASAEGETVYTMSELEGKYKTQGRTALVGGDLMLEWSASGVVFKADCSGDVKITVNAGRLGNAANQGIFFTVIEIFSLRSGVIADTGEREVTIANTETSIALITPRLEFFMGYD